MNTGLSKEQVYQALGSSRQAVAQYQARRQQFLALVDQAEQQLLSYRKDHPGLGLVKAYHMISPEGLGRDRFVHQMRLRGHALRIKRNYMRTTRSDAYRYPNLIKHLIINSVNQVWQSDTTYFRVANQWLYLTFIIDVYSRRIVGYHASTSLAADANVKALKMALRCRKSADLSQLIFHSDGGTQYRFRGFTDLLRQKGISSSMCTTATDNAYAEKLNDVIKNEYLTYYQVKDIRALRRILKQAVNNYNRQRHHGQLPNKNSPMTFEQHLADHPEEPRRPLLIRDGQAPAIFWDPAMGGPNLANPVVKASKGVSQILPAHVIWMQAEKPIQLTLKL